jgi:hypothetical protein
MRSLGPKERETLTCFCSGSHQQKKMFTLVNQVYPSKLESHFGARVDLIIAKVRTQEDNIEDWVTEVQLRLLIVARKNLIQIPDFQRNYIE